MTCMQLASELEVARRTVLRDVDALTEAGLPVVVIRGPRGGIELGFNYRSRLTGLSASEAEALGVLLAAPIPMLEAIGLGPAGQAARSKLLESLPDNVRLTAIKAQAQFRTDPPMRVPLDPRVEPLARAIRERRRVRIRARSSCPRAVHPVGLQLRRDGWFIEDALVPQTYLALVECDDINISAITF